MDQSLPSFAQDSLREVMNIGAGNAATALSQLTGTQVDISTPRLEVKKVETVPDFVSTPDTIMSVVLVKVLGDAPGVMLLMFPRDSALKIAHSLMKQSHTMLDEMDRTALREVGNVLAGSCLTALSNFLKMSFVQSVPNAATDMVGALLSGILADIGKGSDDVLVSEVHFVIKQLAIDGSVYFIFDPASTGKILAATQRYLQ